MSTRLHSDDLDCWCEPTCDYVTERGGEVWVHHDPDGEQPPPEVLAEAIAQVCMEEASEGDD